MISLSLSHRTMTKLPLTSDHLPFEMTFLIRPAKIAQVHGIVANRIIVCSRTPTSNHYEEKGKSPYTIEADHSCRVPRRGTSRRVTFFLDTRPVKLTGGVIHFSDEHTSFVSRVTEKFSVLQQPIRAH